MNSGQTMLTLCALVLLTLTVINMNRILIDNDDILNQSRFGLETVALATSFIEEASQLPFDEQSWDSTIVEKQPSDFTHPNSLGKDAGESGISTFDDFDDYHNYTKAETTMQNIYNISCEVDYVDPSTPNSTSVNRTFYKKITVTIANPINTDTLRMSYIHGFWYFN